MDKLNRYLIKLSKPYHFENQEFTEIDLSGLENTGTKALLTAERAWTQKGNASNQMETSIAYCLEVAAVATEKPFEFFEGLPKVDGVAVKGVVQRDFLGLMA